MPCDWWCHALTPSALPFLCVHFPCCLKLDSGSRIPSVKISLNFPPAPEFRLPPGNWALRTESLYRRLVCEFAYCGLYIEYCQRHARFYIYCRLWVIEQKYQMLHFGVIVAQLIWCYRQFWGCYVVQCLVHSQLLVKNFLLRFHGNKVGVIWAFIDYKN